MTIAGRERAQHRRRVERQRVFERSRRHRDLALDVKRAIEEQWVRVVRHRDAKRPGTQRARVDELVAEVLHRLHHRRDAEREAITGDLHATADRRELWMHDRMDVRRLFGLGLEPLDLIVR